MKTFDVSSQVYRDQKNATFLRHGDKINFSNDILLAFSPTNYHCFIICKDIEYHPHFSYNATRISPRREEAIRAAAFFHIKVTNPDKVDAFHRYLLSQENRRYPSCHMGVIYMMWEGLGIKLDRSFRARYTPSRTVHAMVEEDNPFNKAGYDADLYLLKHQSVEELIKGMNTFENKFYYGYWISDFYLLFWKLFNKTKNG